MVADTWIKLGFVFDPEAIPAERITWWVDGVAQTTFVTQTQATAATFPDAEPMGLCLLTKVGGAVAAQVDIDWWYAYQKRV